MGSYRERGCYNDLEEINGVENKDVSLFISGISDAFYRGKGEGVGGAKYTTLMGIQEDQE